MIHIYTDGACEPNPGAGGWAFVVYDQNGFETNNRNGGSVETTNNIMELTGVFAALVHARNMDRKPDEVTIYSDSQYVVNGCNDWRHGWEKKGWRRGKAALANSELWQAISAAHDAFPCKITWVRGHSGVPGNERADRLAAKGRQHVLDRVGIEVEA